MASRRSWLPTTSRGAASSMQALVQDLRSLGLGHRGEVCLQLGAPAVPLLVRVRVVARGYHVVRVIGRRHGRADLPTQADRLRRVIVRSRREEAVADFVILVQLRILHVLGDEERVQHLPHATRARRPALGALCFQLVVLRLVHDRVLVAPVPRPRRVPLLALGELGLELGVRATVRLRRQELHAVAASLVSVGDEGSHHVRAHGQGLLIVDCAACGEIRSLLGVVVSQHGVGEPLAEDHILASGVVQIASARGAGEGRLDVCQIAALDELNIACASWKLSQCGGSEGSLAPLEVVLLGLRFSRVHRRHLLDLANLLVGSRRASRLLLMNDLAIERIATRDKVGALFEKRDILQESVALHGEPTVLAIREIEAGRARVGRQEAFDKVVAQGADAWHIGGVIGGGGTGDGEDADDDGDAGADHD
mmetsp:Transcript_6910/g.13982  ORF Transcript_6910/g.13982 Transcript_6910/m.13982 type:complete len:423 (+) Transcript_6910:692-1960(+)|eukprot:CAMPEP_0170316322 /NCGR_PEP_ID=MMETSP0116_2-20130129/58788_1 /TAXON_ID=400756 /ORGANISM="Durinskia baltica, Strain CSIRO CS-38" /LENGTH=422 /DNA_ID=CAMNT_0010568879 /DNA_START=556 /DNA_END=1824 /DNA_ORIENTATION=+